ncbi:MAG: AMP-binding protein [Verrucomicrobiales bacterium]
MNIADLLTARASTDGDSLAVIDDTDAAHHSLTFGQFERAATRIAAYLHTLRLRTGDRVLVLQPLSLELCLILVAILRAGLVAVFVDPSAGLSHLDSCCRTSQPRAFIGSRRAHLLRLLSPGLRRIPMKWRGDSLVHRALTESGGDPESFTRPDLPATAPALVRFTSGSTGVPKAAVRSHGFLLAQLRAIKVHLHLEHGQTDLITMPMFMLPNLAAGITSVLPAADIRAPGRIDAKSFIRQIHERRPDRLTASPALLQRLVEFAHTHTQSASSLRRIDTGGAPVHPRLLDHLQPFAPNATVTAVYGSTEAEPIALLPAESITATDRQRMASGAGLLAGRPVPDIEIRMFRVRLEPPARRLSADEFEALSVSPGQPGEIVVHGPHVHPGDTDNPAAEPTKLFVGKTVWHRTGDVGRLEADGRLWLLGRSSARLDDPRGTLYPFEIETAALMNDSIRHAALVAIDGRRILAVEPTRPGHPPIIPDPIRTQVDDVRIVRALPLDRRHNAKIDYAQLRRRLFKSSKRNAARPQCFE